MLDSLNIDIVNLAQGMTIENYTFPAHPSYSPREIVRSFANDITLLYSEDLASGLGDIAKIVLQREGTDNYQNMERVNFDCCLQKLIIVNYLKGKLQK